GAGPEGGADADPRRHRRLQGRGRHRPHRQGRHRQRLPRQPRDAGQRRDRQEQRHRRQDLLPAPHPARPVRRPEPGAGADLGPARLRQPAGRAGRRQGRLRRPLVVGRQGAGRHLLPGVVMDRRIARAARRRGFTLIELLIVLAIVGTLLTIAVPSYFASLDNAKETSLKQSLSVMRTAIDHYKGDQGKYPETLQELVNATYLRNLPADPITGVSDQWTVETAAEPGQPSGVKDVHSAAPGNGKDGTPYATW